MKKTVNFLIFLVFMLGLSSCGVQPKVTNAKYDEFIFALSENVPEYERNAHTVLNDNVPLFSDEEISDVSFEYYSSLDFLGRCGMCVASVSSDIMPTEERGTIGMIKPSGWKSVKYDNVDGKYLYNRCHLIGFQLTGENANERNLITGTRYMNTEGMLPFENMVAEYVEETGNHVMYRATPVFFGENLVASGVLLEGYSVEDEGRGITFCVFCHNVQPGIEIDYADGNSRKAEKNPEIAQSVQKETYILNKNSKKIHLPDCSGANSIKEKNKETTDLSLDELIAKGYEPCGLCNP